MQARHVALGFHAFQLGDEALGALHVRVAQIEAVEPLVNMAAQGGHAGTRGNIGAGIERRELAVAAVADPRLARAVPQIPVRRRSDGERAFGRVRELL